MTVTTEQLTKNPAKMLLKFIVAVVVIRAVAATISSNSYCISDCSDLVTLTEHEELCCNSSNIGNVLVYNQEGRHNIIICPSSIPGVCEPTATVHLSCSAVLASDPAAVSGYYDITLANGSIASVYCDMEGSNCDGEGGWMRVADFNLAEPGATCPEGLRLVTTAEGNLCYQETSNAINRCDSSFFSSKTISYSKVCGRVRGYRDGNLNGFSTSTPLSIDSYYVDGVSITYDSSPRRHIWTYVGSFSAYFAPGTWSNVCPCNVGNAYVPPSFVGDHYYCESADASRSSLFDDPLWNGQDCQANELPCCSTTPNIPWFVRTLDEDTSSDIELRVCAHAFATFQDTPLDIIELYVK